MNECVSYMNEVGCESGRLCTVYICAHVSVCEQASEDATCKGLSVAVEFKLGSAKVRG